MVESDHEGVGNMFEVHYSDGADHEGVGTFKTWAEASRFMRTVRSCGYEASVKNPFDELLDTDFDAFDQMSNEYHQAKYGD
jgi:hypothetical protein